MNIEQTRSETHRLLAMFHLYGQGWRFELGRGKVQLGLCKHRQKKIRISAIHIQRGTNEEVMDTIKHELAHAIVGPGHGHDATWKEMARALGVRPRSCTKLSNPAPHKYELVCTSCNRLVQKRHKRMSQARMSVRWCRRCGPAAKGRLKLQYASVLSHS